MKTKLGHTFSNGLCTLCNDSEADVERLYNVCPGKRLNFNVNSESSLQNRASTEDSLKCPKCQSTQLGAEKRGFGLGKAVGGGLLLGPVGLLGGFIGGQKVVVTCLKCGNKWKAGAIQ